MFDTAWLEQIPEPEDLGQIPASQSAPSGWLALELDHGTVDPAALSDAELIDTSVGFDRVVSWASARQAALLAEFARRRPADDSRPTRSDVPTRCSESAPDEVGLALRLSRTAAANRLVMAQVLVVDLPGTLTAWQAGTLDVLKVRAIAETSYLLPAEQRGVLETRVLPRAGAQTVSQLRAALARALLSAPDATAAYQQLCRLARGLGAEDPRRMDARRADLLVELLTGPGLGRLARLRAHHLHPTVRAGRLRPRPRCVLPQPDLWTAGRHRRSGSHHRLGRRRHHQRPEPLCRVPPRPLDQDFLPRLAGRSTARRNRHLDHPYRAHLHQPPA